MHGYGKEIGREEQSPPEVFAAGKQQGEVLVLLPEFMAYPDSRPGGAVGTGSRETAEEAVIEGEEA